MTDIQQWRRMIQPTRTRTPAVDHEEAEAFLSPTTPRKALKPKFSSYFTQHANNAGTSKKESSSPPRNDANSIDWPSSPADDPYPSPDADVLIDSVMCRILGSPYERLNPRFNGVLLQIFEGFRALADEKQRLLAKSEQDVDRLSAMEKVMQKSARQWNREKQEYRAEIKRLELLLAKGKRGLAEITLARQDSFLRRHDDRGAKARKHDTLDTIFQFMEKNKLAEEKVWGFQRATMRRKSPSADMRRLSKTLMSQTASYPDLPPGTLTDGPSTLAEASYLEDHPSRERIRGISDHKTSFSEEDTISTFSCAGDLLSDEATDVNLIEAAGTDNDFVAIKRIAHVLARRRHVDADVIMPKLLIMFAAESPGGPCDASKVLPRAQSAMGQATSMPPTRKNTKLKTKASNFFHKLKPQLNIDTTIGEGRRFSFEAGDDSAVSAPGLDPTQPAASSSALAGTAKNDRILKKSASTPLLIDHTGYRDRPSFERELSPVEQSPTGSAALSESRRSSKIPTPVHTRTLARPRRERESSESSLLTAIKYTENTDRRSSSLSSSGYSSPSASRMDLTAGSQGTASNRLLEHTKALRGNAFAAAAAVKAVENTQVHVDQASFPAHEKRVGMQTADMSERREENVRPMAAPEGYVDHKDLH